VVAALLSTISGHRHKYHGVRRFPDAPPLRSLTLQSEQHQQGMNTFIKNRQRIAFKMSDEDDQQADDFEGFGSITEMVKHKDDIVQKQLNDPKFIAQINAEEEAKKKKAEHEKKMEEIKKQAIENAKKRKQEKEMKDRLKQKLSHTLEEAKAKAKTQIKANNTTAPEQKQLAAKTQESTPTPANSPAKPEA
jgi:ATP-dependent Lon protease